MIKKLRMNLQKFAAGKNTRIADVIVPEVFNKYVTERTAESSALLQSGIISNDKDLDELAKSGGNMINMPFWQDLTGEDEILDDGEGALTPGNISAAKDIARLHMRGKAWRTNDLAKALSGDDPMRAIGDLVVEYWNRRRQAVLIASLNGITASGALDSNKLDVSTETGDDSYFTGDTFLSATYKLGDAEGKLTGIAMHSQTEMNLRKQGLIEFMLDSDNKKFPTYMGKRVIVDDGLPAKDGVYTSYIFGEGAFGLGNGEAPVPTETDREKLKGNDILINRQHFLLHPRGIAWQEKSVAGHSPTNTEIEKGNNWKAVYESKNIRIVAFVHKNGVPGKKKETAPEGIK
ncbi:gp9 [Brochothrix phage BL3]|uniref:major head protein n=1 Tax=Brochothrix phage BL3 TaxID=764562 RepID=UPI0001D9ADB0|nr:major head protein [Brochothrix phage BL3]ADH03088.1 gp9 [Brochothrix phage BL3]